MKFWFVFAFGLLAFSAAAEDAKPYLERSVKQLDEALSKLGDKAGNGLDQAQADLSTALEGMGQRVEDLKAQLATRGDAEREKLGRELDQQFEKLKARATELRASGEVRRIECSISLAILQRMIGRRSWGYRRQRGSDPLRLA